MEETIIEESIYKGWRWCDIMDVLEDQESKEEAINNVEHEPQNHPENEPQVEAFNEPQPEPENRPEPRPEPARQVYCFHCRKEGRLMFHKLTDCEAYKQALRDRFRLAFDQGYTTSSTTIVNIHYNNGVQTLYFY